MCILASGFDSGDQGSQGSTHRSLPCIALPYVLPSKFTLSCHVHMQARRSSCNRCNLCWIMMRSVTVTGWHSLAWPVCMPQCHSTCGDVMLCHPLTSATQPTNMETYIKVTKLSHRAQLGARACHSVQEKQSIMSSATPSQHWTPTPIAFFAPKVWSKHMRHLRSAIVGMA
jgi:hypothetical protein